MITNQPHQSQASRVAVRLQISLGGQTGLEPVFTVRHELALIVPLPVSWTREGDINIAAPSSIVDPDASERSRFMGHAAAIAMRALAGVRCPSRSMSHSVL